jgi:hypothetical protein
MGGGVGFRISWGNGVIVCVEYHVRYFWCGMLRSGGWGWVGSTGCLFPVDPPAPPLPITASPAPHHTMHLTPALAPCRGTLSDHLLRDTLSGALRGPLQPHLCHLGRAVYPPLFFPLPRRSQTRPSRALICASISSALRSVVSSVSTRSVKSATVLPISSRARTLTAGGMSPLVAIL